MKARIVFETGSIEKSSRNQLKTDLLPVECSIEPVVQYFGFTF